MRLILTLILAFSAFASTAWADLNSTDDVGLAANNGPATSNSIETCYGGCNPYTEKDDLHDNTKRTKEQYAISATGGGSEKSDAKTGSKIGK